MTTVLPGHVIGAEASKYVHLSVEPWHWVALIALVVTLLLVDLLLFHRRAHKIAVREAAIESAVWISIGLAFTGVIYLLADPGDKGAAVGEYLAAFLIEQSLSVDNVFVWAVILTYFAVPAKYQFRVLFWGVFGAIALRGAFIFAGVALIRTFAATLAVFGLILLYTAFKLAFQDDEGIDPNSSIALRVVRRIVPSTPDLHGQRLFVKEHGRLLATPLFAVLVLIEGTDIIFAFDSIPAIFGVTQHVFIVFSAVVFAMLGLRALYFLVGGMQDRFRYLNYGLAVILAFVGIKLILGFTADTFAFPVDEFHPPVWMSLGVIIGTLVVAIVASVRADAKDAAKGVEPPQRAAPDRGGSATDEP
jgi:tellurite resistance protein TerC